MKKIEVQARYSIKKKFRNSSRPKRKNINAAFAYIQKYFLGKVKVYSIAEKLEGGHSITLASNDEIYILYFENCEFISGRKV